MTQNPDDVLHCQPDILKYSIFLKAENNFNVLDKESISNLNLFHKFIDILLIVLIMAI